MSKRHVIIENLKAKYSDRLVSMFGKDFAYHSGFAELAGQIERGIAPEDALVAAETSAGKRHPEHAGGWSNREMTL